MNDNNTPRKSPVPDLSNRRFGLRAKLISLFLGVKIIPLIIVVAIAFTQINSLGENLHTIAVKDSQEALNALAVDNIERMSTDIAARLAEFLYMRDDDIRYMASCAASLSSTPAALEEAFTLFVTNKTKPVAVAGEWVIDIDENKWVPVNVPDMSDTIGVSTNKENEDTQFGSTFHAVAASPLSFIDAPLYDEVTFIGLDGQELLRISTTDMPNSRKNNYADSFITGELRDITNKANTFVRAEDYWPALLRLTPDNDIYVSDVIGAYVGSNYIGTYTPKNITAAINARGYPIVYAPDEQSYAGAENPNGQRFEGIVRWASPVYVNGMKIGYVTLALNHDHIMEFVDHHTPMKERYVELPSAAEGNYAFIWDYQCRSIAHPRHNSIVGFDPETGNPQIPWVSQTIYLNLLESAGYTSEQLDDMTAQERVAALRENWGDLIEKSTTGDPVYDLIIGQPTFENQARTDLSNGPDPDHTAAPDLTRLGLVGLDGRYLNNAPQCTGWLDLTRNGGSGSLYILWSGKYKLNTAAAIPYYTGRYAPSEANGGSRVGFGFVAIGASIEDFTAPAQLTAESLDRAAEDNLYTTTRQLLVATAAIIVLVVFVAIWLAGYLTNNIRKIILGISRFRRGERQFRFNSEAHDEFGELAAAFDEMADSVVGSVNSPLSITDMDLKLIYMNNNGLEFSGSTLERIVGKPYQSVTVYPKDSVYDPILALQEGRDSEVFYFAPHDRYYKGSANYLLNSAQKRIGYIILTTDVTELSLKQIELEHAVEAANRANEHKGEFLARMSHEIRTPMNAIMGITSIVLRRMEDLALQSSELSEICTNVQQIETSSQHLLSLLNNILDISKIEAGKIEITEEVMNLDVLQETVASIIGPRCADKSIVFDLDYDSIKPATFLSDSLRLRQVLINLLGNAVKFTPELGHVYFAIKQKARRNGRSLIEFIVRDTGIGISEENLDAIFQPFEQGGSGVTRKYGGTGLGLSISRRIVQLLGGDITVTSNQGEGSEFSFELWLTETEMDEDALSVSPEDAAGRFVGKRLLLVDDVEINRMIVATMIEDTGFEIVEADDGDVAVELFEKSPVGYFDIILMDIQMPTLDGYHATRSIRSLDRADAATVPIIALTANAFKDDIDRAHSFGMNSHIAKPVELDILIDTLFKFGQ